MAVIAPGTGWEVFVYSGPADGFGTVLAQVPGWTSLSIAPLGNDAGAGSITIPLSSPMFRLGGNTPDTTPVLAQETLWRVTQDGTRVFDFLAETVTRTTVQQDETQVVTISGPGSAQALNWGMAMPSGWKASGKWVSKLSGIHDPFSTPDPNNASKFVLDQDLWNLVTAGAVSIPQSGTVTVAVSLNGAFLGGGPFDATNSSFSASVQPVALGLPPALSVPSPIVLAQAQGSPVGGKVTFTGAAAADQGSGLILISQGAGFSKGMSAFDSAGNAYKFVTDAFTSGTGVAVWMSPDSKPVTPSTTFGVVAGNVSQALRLTLLRVPPGWLADAGFSFAQGTSAGPALPAQVLRSSPEMELAIVANGSGASLSSAASPYGILESSFGPGNLRMSVCRAASGSAGVAEGDPFAGAYPSSVPWLVTGFSLYWAGGEFGVTASTAPAMNGSEVTQLIVESSTGRGYAMIALSYQDFYCQYQDNQGNLTTHVISPGIIGAATASGAAYNTSWAQFWRISCDILTGNVTNGKEVAGDKLWRFWTSPDGALWTLQWQVRLSQLSFSPASVNVFMGGAYAGAGAAAQFTSLNSEVTNSPNAGPIFLSQPVMQSWLQLLSACQARGTLPFVSPAFTQSADSTGQHWSDSWSLQVPIGTDLLTLLQNYAGAIDGDWIMDPGFSLRAGQQGSLGTDRHATVVFHEGEVTQLGQTQARDQIGNIIVTADGSGVLYTASSASSIAKWHQRERWLAAGGTITGQAAINVAAAGLGQLDDEIPARVIQIPPNQPGKTVFRDFGIFDWIGAERGDFSTTDSLRVIGITVTVDQDGAEVHELILQTYRQAKVQFLTYLVNKLGGQTASALGSLSASSLNNGLPVVALGSQAFIDPPPITGAIGGSSAGLGIQSGLAAAPEIATGGGINGGLITGLIITQDQLGFSLPSGTNVTYSPTAPVAPALDDVWYQTSPAGVILAFNVWNGSQWVPFTVGPQAVSFTAADIGGTGPGIYFQSSPPSGTITDQSLWYDTAHGNRVNIYSAATATWTPIRWGTGSISAATVTAAEIAAATITAQQIATGTLTAQQISAGAITANEIAGGTITADQIATGSLSAGLLAAGILNTLTANAFTINSVNINGGVITVSGANDGVFGYGTPPLTFKIFHASSPFLCPLGVVQADIYVFAAGGGGGNGGLGGGAGGSGGGCCVDIAHALVAGQTYFIGVGNGGVSGGPGTPGGNSWFNTVNSQGGLVAFGGQGGHADGQIVTGGGGSGGDAFFVGGSSGGDTAQAGGGGGGGGGAGSGGNGRNGNSTGTIFGSRGGSGGTGLYPGGTAGSGGNTSPGANGGNGSAPGGGGGGAGQGFQGGSGGDGFVILIYRATNPVAQLIASMAGLAGFEPVNGLPVPAGFYGPQLELTSQSSQPATANAGDGQFWANAFGTPQAAMPGMTGSVPVIQTDIAGRTAANNTGPVQVTKAWTIPANNAQAGTFYEIKVPVDGVFETQNLVLALSIDGGAGNLGGITTGPASFPSGTTINGVFVIEMQVTTTGVTGTVDIFSHGSLSVRATLSTGSNNNTIALAGSNTGIAFDTTVVHNIRVNATWAAAAAGQTVTGHGSKFTRSGP